MSSLSIGRTCFQTKLAYLNNMVRQTLNNMDDEGSKQKQISNIGSDDSDVSEPSRLRCPFLYGIESDREFLCSYHFYFLPFVTIVIWSLFFIT